MDRWCFIRRPQSLCGRSAQKSDGHTRSMVCGWANRGLSRRLSLPSDHSTAMTHRCGT
ncbi:hypothetical protein CY34DRAFT_801059 [Suillus luteus UH-Slu-Lm8-n1]|uniref:Uncharacterized protein n=1 Tax=Suillus luteus UH-Slu-Lm8-n1 TaxID=930992 RepID=A0A0D0BIU1_9AGAM|nr:hypothetical protein CY34DRAFT_801059 [Suillus luteus UH-Slu-Lm8-n1]